MSDALLAFRDEFPILERTTYLVSNSLGAMPRGVPERLAEYVDQWADLGVRAWARGWWEMPISVGNEIAPLIGQMLAAAIADRKHLPLLESMLRWAGLALEDNEDMVRTMIAKRANALLRLTGLDERIANSVLDGLCLHRVAGKGPDGYREALEALVGALA